MNVTVGGSFASGLIISADRPQHLDPNNRLGQQHFVLTPDQSKTLLLVLETKWKVEQEKATQ